LVKSTKLDEEKISGKGIVNFLDDGFIIEAISDKDKDIKVNYNELKDMFEGKLISFNFLSKYEEPLER